MKTDNQLLAEAYTSVVAAKACIVAVHEAGLRKPVPAADLGVIRRELHAATSAVQELENRAIGFERPKQG